MQQTLDIAMPDDWHIHFRDGEMLRRVVQPTADHFARAIVMPNLVPPVVTMTDAQAYRSRIMAALGSETLFNPLMTLYLTDNTDASDVVNAARQGVIHAVKLYPAGATTNSQSGVTSIDKVMGVLEAMAAEGLPLCIHGEVTDAHIDIFDREAIFIDSILSPLQKRLPELKVVLEHITTSDGVDYVLQAGSNTAATVTPHHLMINRNHILVGGIKPHYYCLPVAKRETHRQALRRAVTQQQRSFFLGTDSAPHPDHAKESACGCAGVFNTVNTLSCLAHVFEEENALDQLEAFVSLNGPAFYGLPVNQRRIKLIKQSDAIRYPAKLSSDEGDVTVFDPGVDLHWQVAPA